MTLFAFALGAAYRLEPGGRPLPWLVVAAFAVALIAFILELLGE